MTLKHGSDFEGFALLCDEKGIVTKVLRNELLSDTGLEPGQSLSAFIDENSLDKYFNFLYTLRQEQALYDWDINVKNNGTVLSLYFVGGIVDENLLIVASRSKKQADFYYSELLRVNNEQTDMLRQNIKEKAGLKLQKPATDLEYFEQLTGLNNELANLQRDLHKKNSQLQNVIKARDKYLGMAAHDFRNPLGGISNVCSILLDEDIGPLNNEQKEFIELVKESSDHLLEVVNDMLDFSSIEAGKVDLHSEETDIVKLLQQAVAFNTPLARKKSINFYVSYSVESCIVEIDKNKIMQVFDNLLSNAIKFSHPNTSITVSFKQEEAVVIVSVQDEGQGIPAEELKYLFKPFERPSVNSTGGEKSSGLGLSICKRIVEGHGGEIHVISTPGEGSVFSFTIPLEFACL